MKNFHLLHLAFLAAAIICRPIRTLNKQTVMWTMLLAPTSTLLHTGGLSNQLLAVDHSRYLFYQTLVCCYCSVRLFGDHICSTDSIMCAAISPHTNCKQTKLPYDRSFFCGFLYKFTDQQEFIVWKCISKLSVVLSACPYSE